MNETLLRVPVSQKNAFAKILKKKNLKEVHDNQFKI